MSKIYVIKSKCVECGTDFTYERSSPLGRNRIRCDTCRNVKYAPKFIVAVREVNEDA